MERHRGQTNYTPDSGIGADELGTLSKIVRRHSAQLTKSFLPEKGFRINRGSSDCIGCDDAARRAFDSRTTTKSLG